MKFVFTFLALVSINSFAQVNERCGKLRLKNTLKHSSATCIQHLNDFASRSNAACKISKKDFNTCWSECVDEDKKKLAQVRVDMNSDCGRELVYYNRTVIKYYR